MVAFSGTLVLVLVLFLVDKISDFTCDWFSDTCVKMSKVYVKYDYKFLLCLDVKYDCKFLLWLDFKYDCKFLLWLDVKYDCKFLL